MIALLLATYYGPPRDSPLPRLGRVRVGWLGSYSDLYFHQRATVVLRTSGEDIVPILLRPATAKDAEPIKSLIRRVHINPFGLVWQRFLMAEDAGEIVGCVQVKPHKDSVRELASLAVVPERQGQGVGALLVNALLTHERGELYLMCREQMASYYARFGFALVEPAAIPRSLKPFYRIGRFITRLFGSERIAIMRRASERIDP